MDKRHQLFEALSKNVNQYLFLFFMPLKQNEKETIGQEVQGGFADGI